MYLQIEFFTSLLVDGTSQYIINVNRNHRYQFSNEKNLRLITPIKQYPLSPPDRIKLVEFYNSVMSQELYRDRKISIEPLFQIIKDTFEIRTVPVKGLYNVKSFVLVCVSTCSVL